MPKGSWGCEGKGWRGVVERRRWWRSSVNREGVGDLVLKMREAHRNGVGAVAIFGFGRVLMV